MTDHIRHKFPAEYSTWLSILDRCTNPKQYAYRYYGALGIKRCARWDHFENFLADMGPRPVGMTIEREDNTKDYEPSNCRWASRVEQGRNRSNNHILTFNGYSAPITAWAERIGVPPHVIYCRVRRGWSIERVLTQKPRRSPEKAVEVVV